MMQMRRADHSSSGFLRSVVFITVCVRETSKMRRSWPKGVSHSMKKIMSLVRVLQMYEFWSYARNIHDK